MCVRVARKIGRSAIHAAEDTIDTSRVERSGRVKVECGRVRAAQMDALAIVNVRHRQIVVGKAVGAALANGGAADRVSGRGVVVDRIRTIRAATDFTRSIIDDGMRLVVESRTARATFDGS